MDKFTLIIGLSYGALAVIFGAFGAHYLKSKLTPQALQSFETGVKYQFYHALFLLIIGFNATAIGENIQLIATVTAIGVLLFSFSIYGLVLSDMNGKKIKILGPITPLGGLCLIGGWGILLLSITGIL
ncbi:MAG: hypothetical protein COB81_05755 [Flavobacteriaceae bacterium]|nr:MAG: hypothetical protein COB81_05755 [Flavobacteriaceae bacterium]